MTGLKTDKAIREYNKRLHDATAKADPNKNGHVSGEEFKELKPQEQEALLELFAPTPENPLRGTYKRDFETNGIIYDKSLPGGREASEYNPPAQPSAGKRLKDVASFIFGNGDGSF